MDPFLLFRDVPSPYCFFGFKPTLFDAPSRQAREQLEWLAHSFLAFTPTEPELLYGSEESEGNLSEGLLVGIRHRFE